MIKKSEKMNQINRDKSIRNKIKYTYCIKDLTFEKQKNKFFANAS